MYEYHGWLTTSQTLNTIKIFSKLKSLNGSYPVSVQYVNGKLHIAFSGSPNRDTGKLTEIINYLCSLNVKLSGCIYINNPDSCRYNKFDVIKIVENTAIMIEDKNFTSDETRRLFE